MKHTTVITVLNIILMTLGIVPYYMPTEQAWAYLLLLMRVLLFVNMYYAFTTIPYYQSKTKVVMYILVLFMFTSTLLSFAADFLLLPITGLSYMISFGVIILLLIKGLCNCKKRGIPLEGVAYVCYNPPRDDLELFCSLFSKYGSMKLYVDYKFYGFSHETGTFGLVVDKQKIAKYKSSLIFERIPEPKGNIHKGLTAYYGVKWGYINNCFRICRKVIKYDK